MPSARLRLTPMLFDGGAVDDLACILVCAVFWDTFSALDVDKVDSALGFGFSAEGGRS
jgi:hypothetical protein